MNQYLLISSRDPFEHANAPRFHRLAGDLAKAGHDVTLLLVENAVLASRKSPVASGLSALARAGVRIFADDFSLRERGISPDRLERTIEPANIDIVVDHLESGAQTFWH